MAYDTPVPGYGGQTVNTLRLWSARATDDFDLGASTTATTCKAVEEKNQSENVSRVLYPDDATDAGRELRLRAGILLRQRVAAGHPAPLPQHHTSFDQLPDEGGDPAERHASRDRASPS